MTIAKVQKKFENLKHTVLEDGKIDIAETYTIIDFIKPYVQAGNRKFVRFAALLKKCTEDRVITKQESDDIIQALDEVSKFLKIEAIIEYVLFGGLTLIGVAAWIVFALRI